MSGIRLQDEHRVNRFLWWGCKPFFWVLTRLLFRLKCEGRKNVPRSGPLLVVSNHCSFLDPVLIGVAMPRVVRFLARATLWDVPFIRFWIQQWGAIPVYRGSDAKPYSAVRAAVQALKKGDAVCIFPEGTRSENGVFQIEKVRTGVGFMALQSQCPILPVAIIGSHLALPKGKAFIRPLPVSIRFGSPFTVEEYYRHESLSRAGKLATEKIIQHLMDLLPESQKPKRKENVEVEAE
ncbi:MAG: lysophospholipid acyltransferase family protein [bacterium JZ-2024 1]